jgi:hypothetical protein
MDTSLVQGVAPLVEDAVLVAALEAEQLPGVVAGPYLRLGIEGPTGKVYRTVTAHGPVEADRFRAALRDLRVVDRPVRIGYYAVFGRG